MEVTTKIHQLDPADALTVAKRLNEAMALFIDIAINLYVAALLPMGDGDGHLCLGCRRRIPMIDCIEPVEDHYQRHEDVCPVARFYEAVRAAANEMEDVIHPITFATIKTATEVVQ